MSKFLLPSSLGFELYPRAYQFPKHLQQVQRFILEKTFTPNGRGVITLPVRTGKSFLCSFIFPSWLLCEHPHTRILLVSHSSRFSETFGGMVRDVVENYGSIDKNNKNRADFKTTAGGGLYSCGWGSSVTGRGFDLIIVDDMVKDSLQMQSASQREKQWTWIRTDLLTRLEPQGSLISTLSRRHPQDCCGLFKDQMGFPELKIPALDDKGESIWPERYSTEDYLRIKNDLQENGKSWIWSSLYMCEALDPTSVAFPDYYFEDIFVDEPPTGGWNLISVDPSKARKAEQKKNDPAAVVVANVSNTNKLTVIDGFKERIPAHEIVGRLVELIRKHRPKVVSVESVDLQILLLHHLEQELIKHKLVHSVILKKYEPRADKTGRIELTLSPMLATGKIKIVKIPTLKPLLTELQQFPHAVNDDFADSLAQAIWLASSYIKTK